MAYPIKELLNLMFVNNVNNFINKKLDRFEIRNRFLQLRYFRPPHKTN
jgi:hypothetical protein